MTGDGTGNRGGAVLAAPDKFRGTASAAEVAAAIGRGAGSGGYGCVELPLSDGGEGMLEAFGGGNRQSTVTGPLGVPVVAPWRLDPDGTAVIESAHACGLGLAGGPMGNDALNATTRGVGELVVAAARAGAREVVVGVGGSATTDGGTAAAEVITAAGIGAVRIVVCCDVRTRFTQAARAFGPQKGADAEQVERLTARLQEQRARVLMRTGIDLDELAGSGAAGGLAGGLAAVGAHLVRGFEAVAAARELDAALAGAGLVVTGEGRLDATSLQGKVVGGVLRHARRHGVPALVVVGQADPGIGPAVHARPGAAVVDLSARYGRAAAMERTSACVADAVSVHLAGRMVRT